jgi:Holliday junction resolvasome RuvABC ATP-dependent DNA helicase subunit
LDDFGGVVAFLLGEDTEENKLVEKEKPRTAAPGINIPYKEGDPTNWKSYLGQKSVKRRLELRINAMKPGDTIKALFSAPAGIGKTAIARVLARELAKRNLIEHYFEIVAGKIDTKKQTDEFVKRLPGNSLVFIDEIHGLQGLSRDALLPTLQDNVYAFDEGEDTMTELPKGISWVGATTDVGKVHAALQRRLTVITLEDMTLEDRAILASTLPFPITERAAFEMAHRCWTPWEIKDEVHVVSKDLAFEKKDSIITMDHVLEACAILGIDEHGLRPIERHALATLFHSVRKIKGEIRHGMSASALIATTGMDSPTFYNRVEPKLLKLGYMTIAPGIGREITPKGIKDYYEARKQESNGP